jgi:tetratricopeptide (TPR) repeat protein
MKQRLPVRNKTADSSPLLQRALQLHRVGNLDHAERLYKAVLAMQPDNFDALRLQGILQSQQRRNDEAAQSLRAAARAAPADAAVWNDFGKIQAAMGLIEEAVACFDKAIAFRADHADALTNRGDALMALKRPDDALASYDRALAANPHSALALSNRGYALAKLGRAKDALSSCEAAIALKPDYFNAHNNRGVALFQLGREAEALACCDKAIALKPDYAPAYDNKGAALLRLGRVEEASVAFESAIKLAPGVAHYYHHLAVSRRFKRDDPRLQAMEALAREDSSLDVDERIYAHFALGKALADIEDYERSFRHFSLGAALKRKQTAYDEARVLGDLEHRRTTGVSEFLNRHYGCGDPSPVPVFVVGMPRSGTTLVEQILASHDGVHGAGEINDFDLAAADLGGAASSALHRPEVVSQMSGEDFRRLGTNYLRRIRAAAPSARRIVNKMTENFRFADLIALALPNARIVHVRRDPIDTCVSCFSTLFLKNLSYTCDLAELGRYYRAYEALMNFWRDVLPQGVMIDVQYEDVVADVEGQGRRILDHCGLEWDPRCLDFHRNRRAVRTASLAQVRRPLYANSVGRWRRYEAFLEPLLASLGPSDASADRRPSPPPALAA